MSMCANHILVPFQAVVICFMAFMLLVAVWHLRRIIASLDSIVHSILTSPPRKIGNPSQAGAAPMNASNAMDAWVQTQGDRIVQAVARKIP